MNLLLLIFTLLKCNFEFVQDECTLEVLCDGQLIRTIHLDEARYIKNSSTNFTITDGVNLFSSDIYYFADYGSIDDVYSFVQPLIEGCQGGASTGVDSVYLANDSISISNDTLLVNQVSFGYDKDHIRGSGAYTIAAPYQSATVTAISSDVLIDGQAIPSGMSISLDLAKGFFTEDTSVEGSDYFITIERKQ